MLWVLKTSFDGLGLSSFHMLKSLKSWGFCCCQIHLEGGQPDASVVESTSCSCSGQVFDSQGPHGSSWLSETPVPKDMMPSFGILKELSMCMVHIYTQRKILSHQKYIDKFKKKKTPQGQYLHSWNSTQSKNWKGWSQMKGDMLLHLPGFCFPEQDSIKGIRRERSKVTSQDSMGPKRAQGEWQ